jgi:hypothetical protein
MVLIEFFWFDSFHQRKRTTDDLHSIKHIDPHITAKAFTCPKLFQDLILFRQILKQVQDDLHFELSAFHPSPVCQFTNISNLLWHGHGQIL